MRNNIMFCGFISFSFFLNYYYYLLYGIYEHTQTNTHIQQNQASNMCCSFFWESDVWLWNALFCFLITKFSYPSLPWQHDTLRVKSWVLLVKIKSPCFVFEDDVNIPLVRSVKNSLSVLTHLHTHRHTLITHIQQNIFCQFHEGLHVNNYMQTDTCSFTSLRCIDLQRVSFPTSSSSSS